jgi:ribulose-5-phosphate 4-epimerase/fuculose-1-phosphate aldolase
MARIDLEGRVRAGKPSKEAPFHLAIYRARRDAGGVVHLHARYTTALACLKDLDMADALPPLTPYFAMRVPRLAVVPYYPPGDPRLGDEAGALAAETPAILLRNHGLIAFGPTIRDAAALAEEVEEQARLFFLLGGRARFLTAGDIAELRRRFA